MVFPLSISILNLFFEGFSLFFKTNVVISPKGINQLVFERTDIVLCVVGTENANNILTSFLQPKVKQK
jgi:hypothetical protein